MAKKNMSLLETDIDGIDELQVNRSYAERYDNWRRLEEMQKFKDRYGNADDEESDSSSSEEPEEWTIDQEKQFLGTLSALKGKDPRIYDQSSRFFALDDVEKAQKPPPDSRKPMFLKDYERKLVLQRDGDISESDTEQIAESSSGYLETQRKLKNDLKMALEQPEQCSDGDLLTKRIKTADDQSREDADYYEWLNGRKDDLKTCDNKSQLKALRDAWTDPNIDENERLLRDYLVDMNKCEQQESNEHSNFSLSIPTYEEIVHEIDVDDEEFDREREFERKYNFRYEEPDQNFEKKSKIDEIQRMKAMKREEIEQKLTKLRSIAGEEICINIDDLEMDFDPREYDSMMREVFNDKYYDKTNGEEEKPVFSDSENDDDDLPDYDHFVMSKDKTSMDNSAENDQNSKNGQKKTRKRKCQFVQAVQKLKPIFDPAEKTFEQYFNEFYQLDYEDIIGDMTTRFKYRSVVPNDFGLTTNEVLSADDRQLNAWVSLKKATQYRSEMEENYDVQAYRKKAANVDKKQRIFSRQFGGKKANKIPTVEIDEKTEMEKGVKNPSAKVTGKRKRKRKTQLTTIDNDDNDDKVKLRKRRRKKEQFTDERLKAYGMNPTKFRNKLARRKCDG